MDKVINLNMEEISFLKGKKVGDVKSMFMNALIDPNLGPNSL